MAPGRVARWFEFGLADALGMRPEVERCVECDRMLEADDQFRWVPTLGGTLCSRHVPPPAEQMLLSLAALKLLRAYRRLDIEAIAGLRQPAEVEAEVEAGPALVHPERAGARAALAGVPRRGPRRTARWSA